MKKENINKFTGSTTSLIYLSHIYKYEYYVI